MGGHTVTSRIPGWGRRLALGLVLNWAAAGGNVLGGVVGWRTDWTGNYPEADPPLTWATNRNVKWAAPMPSWANAMPVLVGNKLLVTSEPLTLLCLDADTGQTLWQATNHAYVDVYAPEALAKMQAAQEAAKTAAASNAQMVAQVQRAAKELRANPVDEEWIAHSNEWARKVEAFKPTLSNAQAAARAYAPPARHGVTGWATPTPVSDGQRVWALFGNGVVACYGLDGKRRWAVVSEKQRDGQGQACSPVLAGNRLVIHVNNLLGLDPDTGRELWKVDSSLQWGSPPAARIGTTDAVVSPNGALVRAADGKVLAGKLPVMQFSSAVVQGRRMVFGSSVWEMPEQIAGDAAEPKKLFSVNSKAPGRHYGSATCSDGIIYGVGEGGVMYAVDVAGSNLLYSTNLNLKIDGKGCTAYPSVVAAGKVILVSGDNGMTVVVQAGREFKELARNVLEPFRSTPVSAGKRLYIRTLKKMYCLGQ